MPLLYVDTEGFAIDVNAPGIIEHQLKLMSRKLTSKLFIEHHNPIEHHDETECAAGASHRKPNAIRRRASTFSIIRGVRSPSRPTRRPRRTLETRPAKVRIVLWDKQICRLKRGPPERGYERDENVIPGAILRGDDKGRAPLLTTQVRKGKDGQDDRPPLHR